MLTRNICPWGGNTDDGYGLISRDERFLPEAARLAQGSCPPKASLHQSSAQPIRLCDLHHIMLTYL